MKKQSVEKMHDHLSHLLDKLSAINSIGNIIEMGLGKDTVLDLKRRKVSLQEILSKQDDCLLQAVDIINDIRHILKTEYKDIKPD